MSQTDSPRPLANIELTEQQKATWTAAASAWEKWDSWIEDNMRDISEWLCRAAGVAPGRHMLDVACGTGHPAVLIATRVAPGGRVMATDLSPEMVEVSRRKARRLGVHNIEFREMDAQALQFDDQAFDAATCRLGLMLCPDPVRAAAQVQRVLKPGGTFALAVWDVPAKNGLFTTLTAVLNEFVPAPPPEPTAPGPFRLAAPGELERVLRGAGFSDVTIESRPKVFRYRSLDEFWNAQTDLSTPLRTAIAKLPPAEVPRLQAAILNAVKDRVTSDGSVSFDVVPLCAAATA